jgi:hypothetical protein
MIVCLTMCAASAAGAWMLLEVALANPNATTLADLGEACMVGTVTGDVTEGFCTEIIICVLINVCI